MYLVNGVGGQLMSKAADEILSLVPAKELVFAASSIDRIDPVKLMRWRDRGVTIREASYDNPAQMCEAFAGVERMLLVSTWMIGETRRNQHANAIAAAKEAGVQHIVYTSTIGAEIEENTPVVASDHRFTEHCIRDAGLDFTVIRNAFYCDSIFQYFPPIAAAFGNRWFTNMNGKTVGWVAREDCSRAAAWLLAGRGQIASKGVYEITGQELLTERALFELFYDRSAAPKPEYIEVSDEEYYAFLDSQRVPRSINGDFSRSPIPLCSDDLVQNSAHIGTGYHSFVTDTFEDLTGMKPIKAASVLPGYATRTAV